MSLRVPLFIKPYGQISLFVVNLCPHKGFIKSLFVNEVLYNADPSINDVKYLDT